MFGGYFPLAISLICELPPMVFTFPLSMFCDIFAIKPMHDRYSEKGDIEALDAIKIPKDRRFNFRWLFIGGADKSFTRSH